MKCMTFVLAFNHFRKLSVRVLSFLLVVSVGSTAEQKFTQSKDDLGKIVRDSAQNVLGTCQSWPPKLARNPKDQAKAPDSKKLEDGTERITGQLIRTMFALDQSIKPFQYDASFLRLLDSVDTSDPVVSDDKLFGLAPLTDPSRLNLWGTDLVVVKYDCMSMLSLMVESDASVSIPFFSLNAAFRANSGVVANQTSVFMIGEFQSPFVWLYNAQDQPQERVFAGLKAIDWRLRTNNRGLAQYVSSAHFFTLTKSTANSQTLSVMGNVKGGVRIPLAQLNGTTAGQLSNSLQSDARGYRTYFWGSIQQNVPDLPSLSEHIAESLPSLEAETNGIGPGTSGVAKQSIVGWPSTLCNHNTWEATARNANFTGISLKMTRTLASGSLPTCTITVHFSLREAATDDVADPRFALLYRQNGQIDSEIIIPFHLSDALHLVRPPSASKKQQAMTASPKGKYVWQVTSKTVRWKGTIEVDEKGRVTAVNMKTVEFCSGEATELDLVQSFDMKAAKLEIDGTGQATIDIPLTWNRYDRNCNWIRVDHERLRGELVHTRAYQGDVRYEVAPGKGDYGGMTLVRLP